MRSNEHAELDVSDRAITIRTLRGQVYRLPAIPSATKVAPRPSTARPAARQQPRTSWGGAWPSWELVFSERGQVMDAAVMLTSDVRSEIFVFVHGWNTDRPAVPGAVPPAPLGKVEARRRRDGLRTTARSSGRVLAIDPVA